MSDKPKGYVVRKAERPLSHAGGVSFYQKPAKQAIISVGGALWYSSLPSCEAEEKFINEAAERATQ